MSEKQFNEPGSASFEPHEKAFLDAHLPTLVPEVARAFMDAAEWVEGNSGDMLILEGEENNQLIFLSTGDAAITLKGELIGRCPAGSFAGEITALDGGKTTASVMLIGSSHYFSWHSGNLRKLCMSNPQLRMTLDRAMALDTRKKLMASNEALRQA